MTRDTSADWEHLGETEPWYGVLSAPEFLKSNLTEETIFRFYNQGQDEMDRVVQVLDRHFGPFNPRIALDFGSGLGRLAFPIAKRCEHVYGIDVSSGMRVEAAKQADIRGIHNVEFGPSLKDGVQVDWINSYIVFQHILPRTGYVILQDILSHLAFGGFTSIQLTFAHDRRDHNTMLRDLNSWRYDGETISVLETSDHEPGDMSMYDYDLNKVLMIFARAGVREPFLSHTDHGGVHGFWIFGQRLV